MKYACICICTAAESHKPDYDNEQTDKRIDNQMQSKYKLAERTEQTNK